MDFEQRRREGELQLAVEHQVALVRELMKELRSAKVLTSSQLQAVEDRACAQSGVGDELVGVAALVSL